MDMSEVVHALRGNAQQRLNDRRYIVRVIDARDGWTKSVSYDTPAELSASKRLAYRFASLKHAVQVRNHFNKQDHVKSAWIVFE